MTTSPVGRCGDRQQHQHQAEFVAQAGPAQQCGVSTFIEGEAGRRKGEEAARCRQHRDAMTTEAEMVVARERDSEGHQPTTDIGRQRRHTRLRNQQHDDTEVNGRRSAADDDEPADAGAFVQPAHARPQQRRIAICIDDFGLHAGVNCAALQLAASGRVSAISGLVGAPAWHAGSPKLATLKRDRIDIGLHLDLTEFPLIAASRRSLPALIAGAFSGRIDRRALRAEIAAQLEAFEQAIGRPPDFVDGHRHVHQLPGVREALLELLAGCETVTAPWLRSTQRANSSRGFKPWAIEALGAVAFGRLAMRHGLSRNRCLLGVYDFAGGALRYRALLRGWLAHANDGDLLMCHPSLQVPADDAILPARCAEYKVLAGSGWADLLAEANVAVQPMSRILVSP